MFILCVPGNYGNPFPNHNWEATADSPTYFAQLFGRDFREGTIARTWTVHLELDACPGRNHYPGWSRLTCHKLFYGK